jgi:hypothetical protein
VKPSFFERPKDNPYTLNTEPTEESLDAPEKKDDKKEKDRKNNPGKQRAEEIERKKEKKQEEEKHKKAAQKPEKIKEDSEEALEEKKQRRQSLVERSFHYKKMYEEMPIPRNPWIVARLMVAGHILAIHDQIEQPPVDATPLDELRLLAMFDYMGTIADALESPEAESTPEVQETCETLVQLAEQTLQEGDEDIAEVLVHANNDLAQSFDNEAPVESTQNPVPSHEASAALPQSGAALIAVLVHIRQRASVQAPLPSPATFVTPSPPSFTGSTGGNTTAKPTIANPASPHGQPASLHIPHISRETPVGYVESPRRNEINPIISRQFPESLASFAVTATFVAPRASLENGHTARQLSSSRVYSPERPATTHSGATLAGPAPGISRSPADLPLSRSFEHRPLPHSAAHLETHTPDLRHASDATPHSSRKIEHLPLVSLLAMAETVSIGHGQRLRSAYEKGMIDKDGLVKILKSRAKNHDFLQEYKQQVVRRRHLVQSSPEFLASSHPKKDSGTQAPDDLAHESPALSNDFQPDENTGNFVPTSDPHQLQEQPVPIDPFDTPDEKISHPTWLVPVLISVLILSVGILLASLILR